MKLKRWRGIVLLMLLSTGNRRLRQEDLRPGSDSCAAGDLGAEGIFLPSDPSGHGREMASGTGWRSVAHDFF